MQNSICSRFILSLQKHLMNGHCSCSCTYVWLKFKMQLLHFLESMKTFFGRHAAFASLAAIAGTLLYWIRGATLDTSIEEPRPSSNHSSQISSSKHSSTDVEVCGLENLGRNWCYSNGLLQAMASCPVLCRWIEHLLRVSSSSEGQISTSWCSSLPRHGTDGLFLLPARPCYGAFRHKMPLLAQLDVVIRGVNEGNSGTKSMKGVYEALEQHGWQIARGEHDCHEMLAALFTTVQAELEAVEKIMGYTPHELKQHEHTLAGEAAHDSGWNYASLLDVAWLPPVFKPVKQLSRSLSCSSETISSNHESDSARIKASKDRLRDFFTRQRPSTPPLQSKHAPFAGFFANQLQCMACGIKHAANWDRFECISLVLPQSTSRADVSLVSLLESYTTPDLVEGVICDNCTSASGVPARRNFIKRITIGKLPEVLVLHINRTMWTDRDGAAFKRRDRVWYPLLLDMSCFTYTSATCRAPVSTGVRGLSSLVSSRFSARGSSGAQLPLTRKTAAVASAGGVQTSVETTTSSPLSSTAGTGEHSTANNKSLVNLNKSTLPSKTKAGRTSKEFNCPPFAPPLQWFSSSEASGSSDSSTQSSFISTFHPSLRSSSSTATNNSGWSQKINLLPASDVSESSIDNVHGVSNGELHNGISVADEHLLSSGASTPTPKDTRTKNIDSATSFLLDDNTPLHCNKDLSSDEVIPGNSVEGEHRLNVHSNGLQQLNNNADQTEVTPEVKAVLESKFQPLDVSMLPESVSQLSRDNCNASETSKQCLEFNEETKLSSVQGNQRQQSLDISEHNHRSSDAASTHCVNRSNVASLASAAVDSPVACSAQTRSRREPSFGSEVREPSVLYELQAVIEHSGSASSGHFTTYRRGPNSSNNWYFVSDEYVSLCSRAQALNAEPYILFYERHHSDAAPRSSIAPTSAIFTSPASSGVISRSPGAAVQEDISNILPEMKA